MRGLAWVLGVLILLLQYPLWLGKGSWLKVWDLERQLDAQLAANQALQSRNDELAEEVRDLKTGYDALEERARYELGMIRQDEVFFQVMETSATRPDGEKRP
ncbi:MAG: cell division protein FtsB [Thiobacillaceae bacterium]|jgi:cell division protein FtsB|nr:cell division protein FtsB [Thiobacillaceae bacterium]